MPQTNFFDAIVVGTEPAGLMTAGLLSRKKVRVMLVGQGEDRHTYAHQGSQLSTYPACLPSYGQSSALDDLLRDLALEDPVHRLAHDQDTHLQVVTPDLRLDLFQDDRALEQELARALPDQKSEFLGAIATLAPLAESLRHFLDQSPPLPPDGFRQRARLKRMQRGLPTGTGQRIGASWPWLIRVLEQATRFTSHLDPSHRSEAVTAHLILSLLAGQRIIPDLPTRLAKACEKSGAVTEMNTVAEHFILEGRQVAGFQALRTQKSYSTGILIAGMPLAEAVELVPLGKRRQRNKLAADVVRPEHSAFIINLVIPTEALPQAMARQVLLVRDPQEPLSEDNLIRLLRVPIPDQPERMQISLACMVPHRKNKLGREYLGPLHEKMMAAAAWFIPFLEENKQSQSSPFWSSRAGDSSHPNPWFIHRTVQPEADAVAGMALLSPHTRLRNLFLAGAEILPGLDLEGAALTARQIVDWLAGHKKLPRLS